MYCGAKNLSSRISFCGSTLLDLSYQAQMGLLDMWRMHRSTYPLRWYGTQDWRRPGCLALAHEEFV